MKNLMRLFLLLVALNMATEGFTQSFRVKAGLNLSNMLMKSSDELVSDNYKMNIGFNAGITAEFPISGVFSFEPGLFISTKGFHESTNVTVDGVAVESKSKINLLYIDIPLTAKATFDVGNYQVFGVFGPYIGMGLSGKNKTEVTSMGATTNDDMDIEWGEGDDKDLKRLDAGLIFGAGVERSAYQLGITYGLGLANIAAFNTDTFQVKNRVLAITVGYKLGK